MGHETEQESTEKHSSSTSWRGALEWIATLAVAILIALGIHQFLFRQYVVDGISMVPTLQNGERLLVDRIPYYFGPPKRGDIIVFRAPLQYAPQGQDWVKRVIGLPGDTIQIKNGQLYLNGKLVREPFINGPMLKSRPFGPEKVPPGDLFVMGDNRNVSLDSRIIGPIKISSVIGRVDIVFWPLNQFHVIGTTQEHYLPQGGP